MGGFTSVSLLSASAIVTLLFVKISLTNGLNQSVILVSLDGLGWEFVGSKRANTPNFNFFASGGVKAKNLVGVHPGKTFPAHTTFMTGLYPESHGIVDNKFWDPLYMEKFILEHDCSNFDPKFYNESEPIWLTMQKQGRRTGAYYWPGSTSYSEKPTFYPEPFCYLKCEDYKGPELAYLRLYLKIHCFFNWAKPFQKRIDTVLEWLVSENPPQLVTLYFEQPDMAGHKNGPNALTYMDQIEAIDRDVLGYLVERLMRLQLMDKTNVILLSDHGIIETKDTRQIRIHDYIDPDSYFKNIAAVEHIWPKPGKVEEIYEKLKSADNPHLKVYKKDEIPDKLHWKNNRRIPPIYLVAEEGWLMRRDYNPLAEGKWVEGTHGWPPTENSAGIFYARGPAFKEGYASNSSKKAIDVYALLCYLVGVKPLPNNGSVENMVEFLKKSPSQHHIKTGHPVFTTTITRSGLSASQSSTVDNNGNETRKDNIYSHADITTETTTVSSIPLDQRNTKKEKQEGSRNFDFQTLLQHHSEVDGKNVDRKSQSSPQKSIKVSPTVTKMTKQIRQTPFVLPQTSRISALAVLMSTVGSQLTQGNKRGKATISTQHTNLTSETFRTSDLTQTDRLTLTTSSSSGSNEPGVSLTNTLTVFTDTIKQKSTPILLDTPALTSDLEPLITASTLTILTETYSSSPTVYVLGNLVNTADQQNETLSNVSQQSLLNPVSSPREVQRRPQITSLTDTSINTDAHTFVLSKNFHKTPFPVDDPLWTSDRATTTLKTSPKTNDHPITCLVAPCTNATILVASTMTSTKLTKNNPRASLIPVDINRGNLKGQSDGKESSLGTTTLKRNISDKLTQHYKVPHVSVEAVKHPNTMTITQVQTITKEQLSQTPNSDIREVQNFHHGKGYMTSLMQKMMTGSSAVVAETQHTTGNKFKSSFVIVSSVQVSPSSVSSQVIRTSNISSNSTPNNISTVAFNSSISNETKIAEHDKDDVNTEALIDCPPFENDETDQEKEYSIENTNARSSARATTKPFSYLEAVMILMIVKLNSWLCTQ